MTEGTWAPLLSDNMTNSSSFMADVIPDDMEDSGPTDGHFDVIRHIKFYTLSVIIPLGIIFNSVASMIFLRKRMRNISTAHYFLGLACADNIVLIGEFLLWTSSYDSKGSIMGLDLIHRSNAMCRMVHFLRYMGRLWSSWLVVAICLDRYITIALPNITLPCPCHDIFNKSLIVLTMLALISTALSCPAFFAVGIYEWHRNGEIRCYILEEYKTIYHSWRQAVMIVGELFLPCIIVTIFTALIIIRLARARNRLPGQQSVTTGTEERAARRRCRDAQLTMSLLSVAIAFVILRLPYIIFYEVNRDKSHMSSWTSFKIYIAYQTSYLFAVANYAINFFLYVISGVRFRTELAYLLSCKPDRIAMPSTAATQHASIGRTSTRDTRQNNIVNIPDNCIPLKELKKAEINATNNAKYVALPQTANNDTSQHV